MPTDRREFLESALLGSAAMLVLRVSRAESRGLGIPGPYPGKVVAIGHPGSVLSGSYEPDAIRQMTQRGMIELTGAPAWQDAWRIMFQKGDVVAIKMSPVGGRGPGGRPEFIWEPKTLYFGTDPVTLDKTGWQVIDRKR